MLPWSVKGASGTARLLLLLRSVAVCVYLGMAAFRRVAMMCPYHVPAGRRGRRASGISRSKVEEYYELLWCVRV